METELVQLAREAVGALQAANRTSWLEVAQLLVSSAGLGAIFWGLAQMQQAGRRRDKEIDEMATNMRESTRVVGQALERQGQALERQGQALERQGQAMTLAFTQQGQALERQGEVLAELLRRTA